MNLSSFRAAVVNADLHQDVFGRILGVFDKHIEITVLVEDTGIDQLVFEFMAIAPAIYP